MKKIKLLKPILISLAVQIILVFILLYTKADRTITSVSDSFFIISMLYILSGLIILLIANSSKKYHAYLKEKARPSTKKELIEKEFFESIEKRSLYIQWGITAIVPGIMGFIAAGIILTV